MNPYDRASMAGAGNPRSRTLQRERYARMPPAMSGGETTCPDCRSDTPGTTPLPLAFAYVPSQTFENLYSPEDGWRRGTLFAALDKPYEGGCCQ